VAETEMSMTTQQPSGLMAAESNRFVAEIQGQMVMARQFPRTFKTYMPRILEACQRKKLAQGAAWSFPRGKQIINGPSIRLAEVIAQAYGNLDYGVRELANHNGESLVQSYCYDLETNVRAQKTFTVKHVRFTKTGGTQKLKDPRDIYEAVANYAARRLRACILGIVPGDIVDKALAECDKTLSEKGQVPIKDKITSMIGLFEKVGVSVEMVEKRLQHKVEATDWPEIVTLGKIYTSIVDGAAKRQDFFDLPRGERDSDAKVNDLKNGLQGDQTEITIKGQEPPPPVQPDPPQAPKSPYKDIDDMTARRNPENPNQIDLTIPGREVEIPADRGDSDISTAIESDIQRRLREQIEKNQASKKDSPLTRRLNGGSYERGPQDEASKK